MEADPKLKYLMALLLSLVIWPHHVPMRLDLIRSGRYVDTATVRQSANRYQLSKGGAKEAKRVFAVEKRSPAVFTWEQAGAQKNTTPFDLGAYVPNITRTNMEKVDAATLKLAGNPRATVQVNRSGNALYLNFGDELFVAH